MIARVAVVLGSLALAWAGCDGAEREGTAAEGPGGTAGAPGFVGRAACGECHAAEVAAFAGSHHDLAMTAPDDPGLRADFDEARVAGPAGAARFHREDGRPHVEAAGRDGAPVDRPVAWGFGVEPLQQVLLPAAGGRLQAFGLAYDTRPAEAGGRRWRALFPDARPGDPLHWTGYLQTANHQCLECHTTGYVKAYDPGADAYASRWQEEDVSCEACHGPGARHVAWARAGGDAADGDRGLAVRFAGRGDWTFAEGAPIARRAGPGEAASLEVEVCARCHARRERFTDDDRAGRPFLDAHRPALLEPHLYHADGQPREEVYVWGSFLQSRMAAAGVTCADCHEPHALRLRAEGNALCTGCHRADVYDAAGHHHHPAGSEAARCVTCHMPETVVLDVDARREHAFRVPRPDRGEDLGTPDVCTGCHAGRTPRWAAEAIEAWYGPERPAGWRYPEALARFRAVRPGAEAALAEIVGDPNEPAIARATAARALGAVLDAATAPVLAAALGDPDPLVRMAAAEAAEALPPAWRRDALGPLLADPVRAVRIAAARSLAGVAPAPADAARHAAALDEAWAAARRNADRPEARLAASALHARLGDLAAARREAEAARAIDPGWPPVAVDLADVLRAQGRDDLGEDVLREAIARAPESPELHHALGLLLVRRGRMPAAAEALGRAASLAGDGRFAYAHGLALVELGRAAEGLDVLAGALAARPGDRRLLTALATLHRDRGEPDAALRYARRLAAAAPGDPRAAALVAELEAGRGP